MLASFPASRDRVKGAYLATADEDTKPYGIRAKVCTRVSGVGRSGLWSGEVVHDDCHAAVSIGVCERLRVQEELEQARRDLVGAFSGLLDECDVAWGAYRIATDRMRSAYVLALLDESETASAFAGWAGATGW
jgi:hypothetical protein